MRDAVAMQRYLQRHAEASLPDCPAGSGRWSQVLVIPAYRESIQLLDELSRLPARGARTLVILVLNRPDWDTDAAANEPLREALHGRRQCAGSDGDSQVLPVGATTDLYLHDMETLVGPLPKAHGVGLARKTGCDIALRWRAAGAIDSDWICCTDADARLPSSYFEQLAGAPPTASACVFPFRHIPAGRQRIDDATALYELRLHHYVLGLEYAGSPYAWHSLGSSLAVRAQAYAHCRGFPRRSGAEDFYLLNKLAKLGDIARLRGDCVQIASRPSRRVPFGTGPAVQAIAATGESEARHAALFYHPDTFTALRAVLCATAQTASDHNTGLREQLAEQDLAPGLLRATRDVLRALDIDNALAHCHRQRSTGAGFLRHFHQWFDGFRTLKFIHGLRDAGWPNQPLSALQTMQPMLWPSAEPFTVEVLRAAIARHWGWRN
ncbi:MAG: hypothetical protein U5K56_07375 [Halioglobus sp.]|nr:hypothetical protein [Halioglobus sp.]